MSLPEYLGVASTTPMTLETPESLGSPKLFADVEASSSTLSRQDVDAVGSTCQSMQVAAICDLCMSGSYQKEGWVGNGHSESQLEQH
jgi:hypothetical protein